MKKRRGRLYIAFGLFMSSVGVLTILHLMRHRSFTAYQTQTNFITTNTSVDVDTDMDMIKMTNVSKDVDMDKTNTSVDMNMSNTSMEIHSDVLISYNVSAIVAEEPSFLCSKLPDQWFDFKIKPMHNCSSTESFIQLNDKRKLHLEKVCQGDVKYNRELYLEPEKKDMFYFRKAGLNWCPVFKAASTNVNEHMCPLYYGDDICKNKGGIGVRKLWRGNSEFTEPINGTDFIVVRNPFHRVLSGYNNKLGHFGPSNTIHVDDMYEYMILPHRPLPQHLIPIKARLKRKAVHKSKRQYNTKKEPLLDPDNPYEHPLQATFPEFISALISGWVNNHWISVNNYCAPCTSNYTYILKVEDFTCEFDNFLNATGETKAQVNNTIWNPTAYFQDPT